MPTYVYRCNDCDYTFEVQQSFSDKPLTECPECDEGAVRRVINPVGIVFKGTGFYVTDNRNGKGSNGTSSTTTSESKTTNVDSKADSKTEKASTDTKSEKTVDKS